MYQCHVLYSQATPRRPADPKAASLYLERAARMGHFAAMLKMIEPMLLQERWEELVPWLLRLESKKSLDKFVELYRAGVKIKPFAVFRGVQILQGLAERNSTAAQRLLAVLQNRSGH